MGMNMGSGGGSKRFGSMSEINVTPLVDIMLVLLVIFMITAPLLNQGVEVDLPQTVSDPLPSEKEPLVVSVLPDGRAAIEDRVLSVEALTAKIHAIRKANPTLVVYVRGDKKASYGAVMAVMSQLQQAGVNKVGLVTEFPQ
ncbi:MAG: protein TolR [Magnetococcales bacterium]|nr:protein TolR [Magnetococcales bacterium]